ncbi:MAG: O-antigen polysaccharide polymerase Wzy [Clostridium perfringens]|uniref:O-antigen polysaccharide polymerase Wzy n=1 Tax=Clostridium perfringens TaxID=1502 RepID=UPI001A1DC13F|nr:O-antigen polysaccharide polymerase Wzy [Clostridium perfringens]MDU7844009.1 O-antigen polysaccharide polymerase Wzy [Clostridium perfringens]HAT4107499.1 O-antigen polysaccharide polymerase Wzy [Clostridium perfringens]HAT4108713.1 O-antigen polysaccharide polymerase Wzy [Clostridium perfringens]HAT4359073.1 O-antigen polysaccharide polymerase Wzy [Clostridium perfringens]HAT4361515.1 O-antigen polysaccharide polymerase Wzy [Clostridium perfringens]
MINRNSTLYAKWDEIVFLILAFVWFVVSLVYNIRGNNQINYVDNAIYFFCVMGTLQLVLTVKSIKRLQGGCLFSLYFIFFLFLYIFSYGQFLMWTFGIHYKNEMTVSHHVRYIDKDTVVRIQTVSLELLAIFHWGVLIVNRRYKQKIKNKIENKQVINLLKHLALPILVVSWVINLYYSISGFKEAAVLGYSALFDQTMPPLIKYISYMFVPSLFLVLITRNYQKKYFYILTIFFLTYALPLLITGDRGSWIYFLGPWLWLYIRFVNTPKGTNDKLARRRTILSIILVMLILFISASFVSVRSEGYTAISSDSFSLDDLYTPFVKPFFEMGQSARILGIIIQDSLDKTYQYGNTYIADILGMILPRIKVLFGFPDMYVENWMSTDYLNMVNYGVGFSAFAEAYLNGGLYFSWFYMLLFGMFIGKLTIIRNDDVHRLPIKTYLALSATTVLGPSVRATLDLWLRQFFWGALLVLLIAKIVVAFSTNKKI